MEHLFSPVKVGSLTLKNRIVMPAMHLGYCNDRSEVTDRLVAFYEERARGGAALLFIGGCTIDPYASSMKEMIGLSEDRFIPGLAKLTAAAHRHGALMAAQLFHGGRYVRSGMIGRQPIAPSPIASGITREVPRQMTPGDIQDTIANFAEAAARAKRAGFDAVEVLAGTGYLISEFFSPLTNQRTDEYGGSPDKRMRFGIEVAWAIREAVGPGYPVVFRIAGNDFMAGGNTNKEAAQFAYLLEQHGVDAFSVTGGWHETMVPQITMDVPRGAFVHLASGVKEAVSKPVIACNRINDPALAERILRDGRADLVGLARALLADPEFPVKAMAGRTKEIVPCIGCNQGCLDRIFNFEPVECLVNPRAGREFEVPPVQEAAAPKKVMVVGGGPAGLSAARTAAQAGHRVTLYEREATLGGQMPIASATEERREMSAFLEPFAEGAKAAGAVIRTGEDVGEDLVKAEKPDVVILATGGEPLCPPIPGIDNDNVEYAWDVLAGKAVTGKAVVVIGGGAVGIETALSLAKIGAIDAETLRFLFLSKAEEPERLREYATRGVKKVTIVEMLDRAGSDIGLTTRWIALRQLSQHGVRVMTHTKAVEITPQGLWVEKKEGRELIPCDTVVMACGTVPVNPLEERLRGLADKVIVVGDAKKARKAYEAIHEAFFAAREL
ncbi:MAG: FAD-dependent oxidoreductase [Syntrophales bacterium]|nr:FAD-dependent oxidoreductase [Syntrophales bacterium]